MEILQHPPVSERNATTGRIFTTFNHAPKSIHKQRLRYSITRLDASISLLALCFQYLTSNKNDTFVFNGEARLISLACLLKALTLGKKAKIIAVDMVLRLPSTPQSKCLAWCRKALWKQVNHFIHYFKDVRGYTKHFGIDANRSHYVPFKSNIYMEASVCAPEEIPAGHYIFSAGRSLRDYTTLIEAARITGLPTAILCTSESDWDAHGTKVDLSDLPDNVRIISDNGSKTGWIDGLKNARIVAIPTLPNSICASGIGTYLDAMALGKPVIITKGPGANDVLNEELVCFVQPASAKDMANAMQSLWHNNEKARSLSKKGRNYALSLGDHHALIERVLSASIQLS
ncbi:glycosyltransferase [Alteromonas sediminis]|uniref:Glycosyltransferase n=1 Tax=Alteromonas sediminis TaxID=2259342 RepID=A0A3N5ZE56_9ALTE|nr:glycosyltransferase [Alteromonas sediminis]RPJ68578.1 glycosyltransferase [Alteromonas sediminis]